MSMLGDVVDADELATHSGNGRLAAISMVAMTAGDVERVVAESKADLDVQR